MIKILFSAEKDVADVGNEANKKNMDDSVILITEDEDSDIVYVGTSNAVNKSLKEGEMCEQSNASGYFAGSSSSASSDISFGTPPDRTEFLRMLYSGQCALIPDEALRPPPRGNQFKTSTPNKKDDDC